MFSLTPSAVLSIVIAGLLVWLYVKTKNLGYLVLTVAIPGWWFVSLLGGQFIFQQADRLKEGEPLSFPFSLLNDPELPDIMRGFAFITFTQLLMVFLGFLLFARQVRRESLSLKEDALPTTAEEYAGEVES
jgi:hypothetical protein